jgi:hypothetical protein
MTPFAFAVSEFVSRNVMAGLDPAIHAAKPGEIFGISRRGRA